LYDAVSRALIFLPTHDHQDRLLEAVKSVHRQAVDDWELVAILDGSLRRTVQIMAEFADRDSRISYVVRPKEPRLGETCRDAVILATDACVITQKTDDNLWLPTHLETMLSLLEDADFGHALLVVATISRRVIAHPATRGGCEVSRGCFWTEAGD
jgi:glycosyltransferase involved in cell wall biosynthesis